MASKRMFKDIPGFDDYLYAAYCDEGKTMRQIADELGCTQLAILGQLRRCGIETRKTHDYKTTEKQRDAWRKIGAATKGRKMSDKQKSLISQSNRGKRRRNDYEFGGHEKLRDDGYVSVYFPDHPNANKEGYVMKHRLVMERALGIVIPDGYIVHHINHIRDDNRIENLALMTFRAHAALHMAERIKERRGKK